MKTIELKLYDFSELSEEAKEKARTDFNFNNDMPFLADDLLELLKDELDQAGITIIDEKALKIYYRLAYCQGDGLMFEGDFKSGEYTINIKQSGHYYHSNSANITIYKTNAEGEEIEIYSDDIVYKGFKIQYDEICKKLEKIGYEAIEYESSAECFAETCEANDYTFEADGTMRNY